HPFHQIARSQAPGVVIRRSRFLTACCFYRLHPRSRTRAPVLTRHLRRFAIETHERCALLIVRPFIVCTTITASADFSLRRSSRRHPFGCTARSPQVRTRSFTIRPPDLRRLSLDHRDLRFFARSPRSASPSIRFLFVGPSLRFTLPSHARSPSRSCASLLSR